MFLTLVSDIDPCRSSSSTSTFDPEIGHVICLAIDLSTALTSSSVSTLQNLPEEFALSACSWSSPLVTRLAEVPAARAECLRHDHLATSEASSDPKSWAASSVRSMFS